MIARRRLSVPSLLPQLLRILRRVACGTVWLVQRNVLLPGQLKDPLQELLHTCLARFDVGLHLIQVIGDHRRRVVGLNWLTVSQLFNFLVCSVFLLHV